jgi:hypothetical protein
MLVGRRNSLFHYNPIRNFSSKSIKCTWLTKPWAKGIK